MTSLNLSEPLPSGQVSDGYHTFDELYLHRQVLFAFILKDYASFGFRTRLNSEGVGMQGWFIAGLNTPVGQVTYHYPESWWKRLSFLRVVERNADYDGHTSEDVVKRLLYFVTGESDPMGWLERNFDPAPRRPTEGQ